MKETLRTEGEVFCNAVARLVVSIDEYGSEWAGGAGWLAPTLGGGNRRKIGAKR